MGKMKRISSFLSLDLDSEVSKVLLAFKRSVKKRYLVLRRQEGEQFYWYVFLASEFFSQFLKQLPEEFSQSSLLKDIIPQLHEYQSAPALRKSEVPSEEVFYDPGRLGVGLPVVVEGDKAVGLWTITASKGPVKEKPRLRSRPSMIRVPPGRGMDMLTDEFTDAIAGGPSLDFAETQPSVSAPLPRMDTPSSEESGGVEASLPEIELEDAAESPPALSQRKPTTVFPSVDPSDEHPISGQTIEIKIGLGLTASPGVRGQVSLGETDEDTVHTLSVHLLCAGFSGSDTLQYSLSKGTMKHAVFSVTMPSLVDELSGTVVPRRIEPIVVNFYLNHRWAGEAYRNIDLRSDASVAPLASIPIPREPEWRKLLNVSPDAAPPDLLVRIQRDPMRPDSYIWSCLSPHLDDRAVSEEDKRTAMPGGAEQFVRTLIEPIANLPLERVTSASIHGIGEQIYESTAKVFKDTYGALCEMEASGQIEEFCSIQFVTDEPFVPWEIMRPVGKHGSADLSGELLAIKHGVGRWIAKSSCYLPQEFRIASMAAFVSDYADVPSVNPKLPWAKREGAFLQADFGAKLEPLKKDPILDFLENGRAQSLHFACHGKMYPTSPLQSLLILEDDTSYFTPLIIARQEVRDGVGQQHPIVFLNACQLGGAGTSLSLVSGFPAAFLDAGAGAVISPLWTVNDEHAASVTEEFYKEAFRNPDKTLGETLQAIRKRWREEKHLTYLAYVLYGDPRAKVRLRPAIATEGTLRNP